MEAVNGISSFAGIRFNLDMGHSGERQQRRDSSAMPFRPAASGTDATGISLSSEQRETIRQMQQRDREVRSHEQAHQAAAGGLAVGGASLDMRAGPDGHMYAVGGEVQIDTSRESDPDAAIAKAQQIRTAANAPADPSAQDRAVAAEASRMESEARREKIEQESQTGRSSIGGPASLSGPVALSGPVVLSGPRHSVSGPPEPLNRRMDTLGTISEDGDIDGPFKPERYQQQYMAAVSSAMRAAEATSAADAAYFQQTADAHQQQFAAAMGSAVRTAEARAAVDETYYRQSAEAQWGQAEAYSRALEVEARQQQDTVDAEPLPQDVNTLLGLDDVSVWVQAQLALSDEDGSARYTSDMLGVDPLKSLEPIDISRAADPASVLAMGNYPLDRPVSAVNAFNAAENNAVQLNAMLTPDRPDYGMRIDPRAVSAMEEAATTAQAPTMAETAAASAMLRASSAYQNVEHVPTSLAPYGTGISLTV
ncbi:MAG: hypothetical protein J1E80_05925 [Desulfovibrionaceae bacterium]|nr:hypothetical protein [Desulfovibrionaceae bacterium]